jgi:hypothetical protein
MSQGCCFPVLVYHALFTDRSDDCCCVVFVNKAKYRPCHQLITQLGVKGLVKETSEAETDYIEETHAKRVT